MTYAFIIGGAILVTAIIIIFVRKLKKSYEIPVKDLILSEVSAKGNDPGYISAITCFHLGQSVMLSEEDDGSWTIAIQDGRQGKGDTAREALENLLREKDNED